MTGKIIQTYPGISHLYHNATMMTATEKEKVKVRMKKREIGLDLRINYER